jgi:flavodoxin
MIRVIILYAPDEKNTSDAVNNIKDAFKNKKCRIEAKAAKNSSIPDIAASEIVIFGSKDAGKKTIHSDFSEIARALKGINLAGRIAGIFSFGRENMLPVFKKILEDSDITVYEKNLIIEDGKNNPAIISEWVNNIIKTYEGRKR